MVNPQLSEYVSAQKLAGVTDEEISKSLLSVGWSKEDVDAAIAIWSSPVQAPDVVANPVSGQPGTPSSVYGDGSMINVFDLGLLDKNPVYTPVQQKSETSVEQPGSEPGSRPVVVETKPADPVLTTTTTAAALPAQDAPEQIKKGPGKFVIVFLVFLVLGVVGGLVWFMLAKSSPSPAINPVPIVESAPTPPISPTVYVMPSAGSNSALLQSTEFVSSKGFRITQPKNWVAEESGTLGTLVTFSNPIIDEEDGNKFAANINVTSEPGKGLSLDEHIRIGHETLQKTFTSYLKFSEEKVQVDGRDAIISEASFELGVHSLKVMQLVTIVNDTVYVITGTSFASRFDLYKEQMSASLLSFGV